MIRNLKALGLALGAVFAFSAMAASSASAADHFTNSLGGANPVLVTGVSHNNKFEITSSKTKFECTTSKFTGTTTNGSTELTIDPSYEGTVNQTPHETHCTATNGKVTVSMNGCHYVLGGNTELTEKDGTDAQVWITCPAGKVIEIKQPGTGVTITVPPQTPTKAKGGVTYKNIEDPVGSGKKAVEVTATVTGITYECHGFACAFGGIPSHGNDADYTGTVVGTCYEDKDGLPTPITEGVQVSCEVT
jgi:hypothetical protein